MEAREDIYSCLDSKNKTQLNSENYNHLEKQYTIFHLHLERTVTYYTSNGVGVYIYFREIY